ncbi:hypothetical protein HHL16_21665 [Pseudoflavitalea sp. G-6-1-2]|uniref:hypothetical protein n=1 Tax=Pseudoflavitalea sp. G-6-1-2 TaxID=2728841 RepID=UPI00146B1CDF|nr:hypothetical protein [Pseudoflavitalea sp. G-6-1-2]NML23503.1 hypothetical protein [Pseudoflavitalea sp. G-6-1-2]
MNYFLLTLRIIWIVIVFVFLTALTQVGGVIYLLCFLAHPLINNKTEQWWMRALLKTVLFLIMYCCISIWVVPIAAKPFGRVQLPVFTGGPVRPLNFAFGLCNRNYVRPELKETLISAGATLRQQYHNATICYLDAGFPFFDGFPLPPHRSHDDGKKLDLAFFYLDARLEQPVTDAPSPIGYGISEGPRKGEVNMPLLCASKKQWQYNVLDSLVPKGNKKNYIFDSVRTKALIMAFAKQDAIATIFIEPHLKARLGITSKKVRFHGCAAIRHDDHLHVQMK